jgi:hypothetical protein
MTKNIIVGLCGEVSEHDQGIDWESFAGRSEGTACRARPNKPSGSRQDARQEIGNAERGAGG